MLLNTSQVLLALTVSLAPLTLLRIAPLTLTLPFALSAYLFVAHTLGAPDQALAAALLAGTVTALVGMFCVGLVSDTYVVPDLFYAFTLTCVRRNKCGHVVSVLLYRQGNGGSASCRSIRAGTLASVPSLFLNSLGIPFIV